MNLPKFAALPTDLVLAGRIYVVSNLRVIDLAKLERWLTSIVAEADGRPVDSASRPTVSSRMGLLLLDTGEGAARVAHLAISQADPAFTLDDARDLVNGLDRGELDSLVFAAFPEPDDDPKPDDNRPNEPGGMNWHAGVLHLAQKFHYTDEYIFNMPLDRFFGMCMEAKDVQVRPRKRWARRFKNQSEIDEYASRMGNVPSSGSVN